jgi:predicted nucleotidyltransferase
VTTASEVNLENRAARDRRALLQRELDRTVRLLRDEYNATAIMLYGSVASEDIHEWSDLDLVVIKETERRFLDRIRDVIELVQPRVGTDIIVYTPEEFAQLAQDRPFVRDEIVAKGKILYAK